MPIFSRLLAGLRVADTSKEAAQWLDKTDELIRRGEALLNADATSSVNARN
jgi:hypothetical protein